MTRGTNPQQQHCHGAHLCEHSTWPVYTRSPCGHCTRAGTRGRGHGHQGPDAPLPGATASPTRAQARGRAGIEKRMPLFQNLEETTTGWFLSCLCHQKVSHPRKARQAPPAPPGTAAPRQRGSRVDGWERTVVHRSRTDASSALPRAGPFSRCGRGEARPGSHGCSENLPETAGKDPSPQLDIRQ